MRYGRWLGVSLIMVVLGGAGSARGALVFYTDRATWEAAAGAASFTEDFSGFTDDTPFRTSAVALNGMSIVQEGTGSFRNEVDVVPTVYTDNNGTNNASTFVNFPEGGDPGTQVRITFNQANGAFGFETWNAASGEGAVLDVYDGATLLGSHGLAGGDGAFLGYILSGGDSATSVLFVSASLSAGSGGEGFGLDNLAGVNAVPEPSALAIAIGVLGLSLAGARRRFWS